MRVEVRFEEQSETWLEVYVGGLPVGQLNREFGSAADSWTASEGLRGWLAERSLHAEERSRADWLAAVTTGVQCVRLEVEYLDVGYGRLNVRVGGREVGFLWQKGAGSLPDGKWEASVDLRGWLSYREVGSEWSYLAEWKQVIAQAAEVVTEE